MKMRVYSFHGRVDDVIVFFFAAHFPMAESKYPKGLKRGREETMFG